MRVTNARRDSASSRRGGSFNESARQVARAKGVPGHEDLLLALEADTAAYFGHLGKAREFSRRAADSAELAGQKETAAGY
jgi:hypothetical protein